jgi:hypothetical protein
MVGSNVIDPYHYGCCISFLRALHQKKIRRMLDARIRQRIGGVYIGTMVHNACQKFGRIGIEAGAGTQDWL